MLIRPAHAASHDSINIVPTNIGSGALNQRSVNGERDSESLAGNAPDISYGLANGGDFSNLPIEQVKSVQKQIDDKKAADVAAQEAAVAAQQAQAEAEAAQAPEPVTVAPVAPEGNLYEAGNCTFYVASQKPVPNSWGNANEWYGNAQVQGYSVGLVPQAGAIGVDFGGYYGHVFIVDAVYPDGTMLIEEMNYIGLGVIDQRVVSTVGIGFIYV